MVIFQIHLKINKILKLEVITGYGVRLSYQLTLESGVVVRVSYFVRKGLNSLYSQLEIGSQKLL